MLYLQNYEFWVPICSTKFETLGPHYCHKQYPQMRVYEKRKALLSFADNVFISLDAAEATAGQ